MNTSIAKQKVTFLCPSCKQSIEVSKETVVDLFFEIKDELCIVIDCECGVRIFYSYQKKQGPFKQKLTCSDIDRIKAVAEKTHIKPVKIDGIDYMVVAANKH